MNPSIVVIGSCMTDLTSYTKDFPKPGETINGSSFTVGFGGKGANQCIAAARIGASTAMVARVGDDSFGENYLENFKANKINIEYVKSIPNTSTGVATIIVNGKGENSIIIVGGANLQMTPDDVTEAENLIRQSQIIICQGEVDERVTKQALVLARKHKVKTLMNAAPATPDMDEEIYSLSDIFCVNETEAQILTGIKVTNLKDAERACRALANKGCLEVILTLGGDGAVLLSGGKSDFIGAPSVPTVVDTTGAGDAFVGALAYFITTKPELERANMIQRACKIASISVQSKGTQTSFPYKEELKAFSLL